MNKKQAIEFLSQVAEAFHKQGQVQVTPEAYERFKEAVEVLSDKSKQEQ